MPYPSGPGSFVRNFVGTLQVKPEKPHGGPQRRFKDYEEDGWAWSWAHGCGRRICGACTAIDRSRRGAPLCGAVGPDGDRCIYFWGHSHPGDHPMCPPTTNDHDGITVKDQAAIKAVLGYDPFARARIAYHSQPLLDGVPRPERSLADFFQDASV